MEAGSKKTVNTKRYIITIEETSAGGAKGYEARLYKNVGEPVPAELYEILNKYSNKRQIVTEQKFDSCKNIDTLLACLDRPNECGIVSGRKPSGPCHYGHKLVCDVLSFFQQNGAQIFMPIADLEADLDPKIAHKEHYKLFSADNLLDWGASGLDLDAAHVYLQSEELRVLTLGYAVARGLNFETAVDIYGFDTFKEDMPFLFAGITQVGDIVLPQHASFGKKYSFMLSGPDQDGHMNMTMTLAKKAINNTPHIQSVPASLYVCHLPGLTGEKASASNPAGTIYLGSIRSRYEEHNGKKTLAEVRFLNLKDRISDSLEKITQAFEIDRDKAQACMFGFKEVFPEFKNVQTCDQFKSAIEEDLKLHQQKRAEVFVYACLSALKDSANDALSEKVWRGLKNNELDDVCYKRPSNWKTPPEAIIALDQRKIKTPWNKIVANYADKILV